MVWKERKERLKPVSEAERETAGESGERSGKCLQGELPGLQRGRGDDDIPFD